MKIEFKKNEFNFLVQKVKELNKGKAGKHEIKLGNLIFIFRYATVESDISGEAMQFRALDPDTPIDTIVSLVFDVKGLSGEYITEVEVFRDGNSYFMYVVPDRNENQIKKLESTIPCI